MRSVVITGVSKGLGAALFDELYAAGDRILAIGRRFTDAQHARERAEPQRIRLRPTDLSYSTALPTAAELAAFVHGATELVLINNAAVVGPTGAIGALYPDQVSHAIAVNITAPILLTNALLSTGVIRPTGDGAGKAALPLTVLFISAAAAHRPVGGWSVFGASKRAGEAFFDALSAEHPGDERFRVINVNPGMMDTDLQVALREVKDGTFFPERPRFQAMPSTGELRSPVEVARKIVADTLR